MGTRSHMVHSPCNGNFHCFLLHLQRSFNVNLVLLSSVMQLNEMECKILIQLRKQRDFLGILKVG